MSIGWERGKERSVGKEEKEPICCVICCFMGVADMSESKCILCAYYKKNKPGSLRTGLLNSVNGLHRLVKTLSITQSYCGEEMRIGLGPFDQSKIHTVRQLVVLREDTDRNIERTGCVGG